MKRVFVDTGAWYAVVDDSDPNHASASAFLRKNQLPLLTTNFVFDETVTLLRKRLGWATALEFGNRLNKSDFVNLVQVAIRDEEWAWDIFGRFKDKDFSYTDCTSFAVMERLGIGVAFTFDRHFSAMQYQMAPGDK